MQLNAIQYKTHFFCKTNVSRLDQYRFLPVCGIIDNNQRVHPPSAPYEITNHKCFLNVPTLENAKSGESKSNWLYSCWMRQGVDSKKIWNISELYCCATCTWFTIYIIIVDIFKVRPLFGSDGKEKLFDLRKNFKRHFEFKTRLSISCRPSFAYFSTFLSIRFILCHKEILSHHH